MRSWQYFISGLIVQMQPAFRFRFAHPSSRTRIIGVDRFAGAGKGAAADAGIALRRPGDARAPPIGADTCPLPCAGQSAKGQIFSLALLHMDERRMRAGIALIAAEARQESLHVGATQESRLHADLVDGATGGGIRDDEVRRPPSGRSGGCPLRRNALPADPIYSPRSKCRDRRASRESGRRCR